MKNQVTVKRDKESIYNWFQHLQGMDRQNCGKNL